MKFFTTHSSQVGFYLVVFHSNRCNNNTDFEFESSTVLIELEKNGKFRRNRRRKIRIIVLESLLALIEIVQKQEQNFQAYESFLVPVEFSQR